QCELARMGEDDPRRAEWEKREEVLLRANIGKWRVHLASGAPLQEFRRGFVDHVTMNAADFVRQAESLFQQAALLRGVRLVDSHLAIPGLLACPLLRRLRELDLGYIGNAAGSLAASPHLAGLTALKLSGSPLGHAGAQALAASPHLAGLRSLTLRAPSHNYEDLIRAPGAIALAESPYLTQLNTLDLYGQAIGDAGLIALANSPHMAGLTALDISYNEIGAIGETGVESLVNSPHLARLTALWLTGNPLGISG